MIRILEDTGLFFVYLFNCRSWFDLSLVIIFLRYFLIYSFCFGNYFLSWIGSFFYFCLENNKKVSGFSFK